MGKRPIGNILTSLFVDRPISMLKTCREWCPDCLHEWHNSDREIYEPLLWSLSLVAICPHHDRLLEQVCPGCNQNKPIFAAKTRVGRCSHCHDWLGAESKDTAVCGFIGYSYLQKHHSERGRELKVSSICLRTAVSRWRSY